MRRKSEIRQSVAVSVLLAAVLFAVPLMLASPAGRQLFSSETQPVETEPFVPGELDSATVLKVLDGDTVREMTMGEYLTGVLRAEMPASFEEEALKAQACAARTYTVTLQEASSPRHPDAQICDDSGCCQAYLDRAEAEARWGAMRNCTAERSSGPWRRPMDWGCSITGRPFRRCFFPPLQAGRWGQWRHGGIRWTIWWEWRARRGRRCPTTTVRWS